MVCQAFQVGKDMYWAEVKFNGGMYERTGKYKTLGGKYYGMPFKSN